jgi:hypothetical protein
MCFRSHPLSAGHVAEEITGLRLKLQVAYLLTNPSWKQGLSALPGEPALGAVKRPDRALANVRRRFGGRPAGLGRVVALLLVPCRALAADALRAVLMFETARLLFSRPAATGSVCFFRSVGVRGRSCLWAW